jgi:hypothetical protein
MYVNGSYAWVELRDADITKALNEASVAKDTADNKRRVFTSQPYPPYDRGDMWVQGSSGDIMYCTESRSSGSYSASDWARASKYTDDTATNILSGVVSALKDTVDGKTTTWYQNDKPTSASTNDIWYNTSDERIYRFNGSSWTDITTTALKAALDAAEDAQTTADGKIVTYAQASTPSGVSIGDLWIDTDNQNMLYRWDGKLWRPYRDQLIISVQSQADFATVYDSATPPTFNPATGKLWMDRESIPPLLRRWPGGNADYTDRVNWEVVNDTATIQAAQAQVAAQTDELNKWRDRTDLYLSLDQSKKVVRIGQEGLTSETHIDARGMGVVVSGKTFSRFEAKSAIFGNMEIRKPNNYGGLMLDAIDSASLFGVN